MTPHFLTPLTPVNARAERCPVPRGRASRRVLIMRLGAHGDILMATPLLVALRRAWPDAHLTWAVERTERAAIEASPFVDELLLWDSSHWPAGRERREAALAGEMRMLFRDRPFDLFLSFQPEEWPSLVDALIPAQAIGVFDTFRNFYGVTESSPFVPLYQVAYTYPDLPAHRTEQYLLPLRALDIPAPTAPAMSLGFTAEDADRAAHFLTAQDLVDSPFVALAPTATWATRCWPPERFATLGDLLARRSRHSVVLLGTTQDRKTLEGIAARMEAPTALFAGQFTFREMAALLSRAALVVSGDTGPMHAAAALGVPYLALFGPTPVAGRAPLVGRGTALSRPVPCGPCDKMVCANAGLDYLRCLTLISVPDAYEAAAALIDAPPASQSPVLGESEAISTAPTRPAMKKLILRNFQSPGDIVMLTAAVRDLHAAHPGQFLTDVRTPCPELWQNSPYITPLSEDDPEAEIIDCEYPLIHQSNFRPYHFIHGFEAFLSERLGLDIRPTAFKGDIHISEEEREWFSRMEGAAEENPPFWLVTAGGKLDFTAKWWDHERYQKVVDHFQGRIEFVQVGEDGHHHPPLRGVVDLRGSTDLRMLIRLMYHAQGALSPVSLLMHLAAAVPVKPGMPQNRPCVVVAGGREPTHWEAYPHHQFIHTIGQLLCCDNGGCWKSRTVPLGDGSECDQPHRLCVNPVRLPQGGHLPRCLDMITADEVIRRIEGYFEGKAIRPLNAAPAPAPERAATHTARPPVTVRPPRPRLAFATCTDHGFLPGARGLIRSIRRFYPDSADIVCFTDTHDAEFARFAREHNVIMQYPASVRAWAVPLIYEDPRYAADTSHFYHPEFAPPPGAPGYRACARPGFGDIHHLHALNLKAYVTGYCLLLKGYEQVVHIDADAFLLGHIDEMFARHPEPNTLIAFEDRHVVTFPYQPETLPHLETIYGVSRPPDFDADRFAFNAGIMFYRNGPGMRELASDFMFYIESCYHFDYAEFGYRDQGILRNLAAKHEILGNIHYVLEDNACWNPDQRSAEELELRSGQWINRKNWQVQRIYHSYNRPKLWLAHHPSPSVNAAWRWAGGEYAAP